MSTSAFPIDLILAGHAHGGQIRLPKLGALWVPKGTEEYVAGWYTQNNLTCLYLEEWDGLLHPFDGVAT